MKRSLIHLATVVSLIGSTSPVLGQDRPDVLFLGIDDLNDWIGCLGGHPDAKTPNIDRLAKRGVLFSNAHCQSPVCNPSRASMMTSLYPETTGIYFLSPEFKKSPVAAKATPMTVRFADEGYEVAGAGKTYHHNENKEYIARYAGSFGGFGPLPKKKLSPFEEHRLWDWGRYPKTDDEMPDVKIANWTVAEIQKSPEKPRFLSVGFYRPHVPQYAPKKWFDLHDNTSRLPLVQKDDLADIPPYGIDLTRLGHISPTQEWVTENQQWEPLVLSYLACVSFVDSQVGRLLDALDQSERGKNTFIVLYSDHGFHLGEKDRWAKRSIWEDGVHVPVIIAGPGIEGGRVCTKPVELIDLYPTLLELTGLDPDPMHEGNSLVPLLKNPKTEWPHLARSSFGPGNVAIRSERYRYIRYADGSEELYDHSSDPHEWTNLASDASLKDVIEKHRTALPTKFHPILGTRSTGHKAFELTEKAAALRKN
ncbi:MAG: sulfatase [Akkermansiaceae bacterium]